MKQKIKVMLSGLGKVGKELGGAVKTDNRFELLPYALEDDGIPETYLVKHGHHYDLIKPKDRDRLMPRIIQEQGEFIVVDFSHPSAVINNTEFYRKFNLPFVMGTTGGDRDSLISIASGMRSPSIIAPNMAKEIVWLQAILGYGAQISPNLFKGWNLTIFESHQAGKKDFSGTAINIAEKYFKPLGLTFDEKKTRVLSCNNIDQLAKIYSSFPNRGFAIRDPELQDQIGVPKEFLNGHGYHFYIISDENFIFAFAHCINGRSPYIKGTIDAILYLKEKIKHGISGCFNMTNVIAND